MTFIKGAGGLRPGEVKIEFFVVTDKGNCQLSATVSKNRSNKFVTKVIAFLMLKIQAITVRVPTSIAISRKWKFL